MENNSINPTNGNSKTNNAVSQNSTTKFSSARVKKMRGWLGIKSKGANGFFDDGGGFIDYGEGHSGWNR